MLESMLKTLSILVTVGFVSMAVFSFLGMGEHAGYHGRCLAELANNATCPPNSGPVSASLFHLNAFKTFSTGLVGTLIFGLTILLASVLMLPLAYRLAPSPISSYINQIDSPLPADPHLTHWLSRLENSPSAISRRRF